MDFATAVGLADAALRPSWQGPGTFFVSPEGFEDATDYLVIVGAREWLIDEVFEFSTLGGPTVFVNKATGEVTLAETIEVFDKTDAMTQVTT